MEIGPGESGSFEIESGKRTTFTHNRPVKYEIITTEGSIIEVTLPAGVELHLTPHGDIKAINMSHYDAPSGPSEII